MTLSGKPLRDRVDHRVALLVLVDELALVGRPDVELARVADDALLVVVLVALGEVADRDFQWLDLQVCCLAADEEARYGTSTTPSITK